MMDPLVVVAKIQKMMRDNLQRVGDAMISGGVDNMEKYQYMLGQARTYQYLTKGGIIIAQESLEKLRIATNCGYVLKVGPLAYYDKEKFPTGAWCKKGDWVIFARYAGSRLPIEGGEVRLLNDDEVLGTINDPESVLHNI
jgi:co-chaperonin GroES (HSP10)